MQSAASSRDGDARIRAAMSQNAARELGQSDKIYGPNENSACSVRLKQNLKNSASAQLMLRIDTSEAGCGTTCERIRFIAGLCVNKCEDITYNMRANTIYSHSSRDMRQTTAAVRTAATTLLIPVTRQSVSTWQNDRGDGYVVSAPDPSYYARIGKAVCAIPVRPQ